MRKVPFLLITIFAFFACIEPVYAQRRKGNEDNYHFFYLSGGVGYSAIATHNADVNVLGNVGGLVGAGYEFRRSKFWMSMGAQMSMQSSSVSLNFSPKPLQGEDIYGVVTKLNYNFSQKDQISFRQLEVPLLLGYYYNGFYVGGGLKVGFRSVGSTVHTNGTFSLSGDYSEKYQQGLVNYEELGYGTGSFAADYSVNMAINGAVIGELGYDVLSNVRTRSQTCQLLKVGFYFEYSVNSVVPKGQTAEHVTFKTDLTGSVSAVEPQVRPYYYSNDGINQRVAPFLIGVKFTYMLGGSRTGITGTWHRGCQCYE